MFNLKDVRETASQSETDVQRLWKLDCHVNLVGEFAGVDKSAAEGPSVNKQTNAITVRNAQAPQNKVQHKATMHFSDIIFYVRPDGQVASRA